MEGCTTCAVSLMKAYFHVGCLMVQQLKNWPLDVCYEVDLCNMPIVFRMYQIHCSLGHYLCISHAHNFYQDFPENNPGVLGRSHISHRWQRWDGSYESRAAVQQLSAPVNKDADAMLNVPHPSDN